MEVDAEDFCVRGAVEDGDDFPTGEVAGSHKWLDRIFRGREL